MNSHTTLISQIAQDVLNGAPEIEVLEDETARWCAERKVPIAYQLGSALQELEHAELEKANRVLTSVCSTLDEEMLPVADLIALARVLRAALSAYCTAEATPLVEDEIVELQSARRWSAQ